jgi:hypothetical protein
MANRLFHITFSMNPKTKLYEYNLRRLWNGAEDLKTTRHFQPREVSAFLTENMQFDYIQITWDLVESGWEEAEKLITMGLSHETLPLFPAELGEWEWFDGTVRDHIKCIFVPKGLNLVQEEIGIHLDLTPKKGKTINQMAATSMKRTNRLYAPTEYAVFGDVVGNKKDEFEVVLKPYFYKHGVKEETPNNMRLTFRYEDACQGTDGMATFSVRGAQGLCGLEDPKHGDCFRFTCVTPFGMFKGHGMVLDQLEYDAVFYGAKTELTYDKFYFGLLSELHVVGEPNMDFQSLINFFGTGNGLKHVGGMMEKFFGKLVDACQDPNKFTRMMLEVLDKNPETDWVRALATGLGMDAIFPGLIRSDFKMFEPAMNKANGGVVPMSDVAVRRYIMPSPYTFDPKGHYCPELDRLSGRSMFTSGVPYGEVAMYRQPNGNTNEHVICNVVKTPFRNLGRGQIVYLSADLIPEALPAMGGGDFDDPVIIVYDQRVVEHFKTLARYPVVDTKEVIHLQSERNTKYMDRIRNRIDPIKWGKRHLLKQINDAKNATGIGVIVNAGMLDTQLTNGKEDMLEDLSLQIDAIASDPTKDDMRAELVECYTWLEKRPDFMLRDIMSNLESRIDRIKMLGGSGMSEDEKLIEAMYEDTRVFPKCWTIGGFMGMGRIPDRIAKTNPIVAKTSLCKLLDEVKQEIDAVHEAFKEMEWLMVKPLPNELLTHYKEQLRNKDLREFVTSMREWWFEKWEEARANGWTSSTEGMKKVYKELEEELLGSLEDSEFAGDVDAVAVELARRIYKTVHPTAPLDEFGKTKHVGDGLLWTKTLGHAFLRALENAGLTGRVEPVSLYPQARDVRPFTVKVKVVNGIVQNHDDGRVLGTSLKLEDGEYTMSNGVITIRPAHPSLKVDWTIEETKKEE